MKKFLKILAGAAALAAVVPFKCKADENGGEVKGLLYKVNWSIDPDYQSDPEVNVSFGFNNPFHKDEESHLFADEIVVDYCCDDTLVRDCEEDDCCEGEEEECTCGCECTEENPCEE